MKKRYLIPLIILLLLFTLSLFPDDLKKEGSKEENKEPISKNGRLLGVDVTVSSNGDYSEALSKAKTLGTEFVTLSLAWDDIEKSPTVYENENLAIANSFYTSQNIKLVLIISPIDTNNLRLPEDLKDKNFDDPEVIERFNKLLDYVISETPDVDYISIAIGNEIDIYLGNDKSKWVAYEEFFKQTSTYLKSKKQIKVGTKITFDGMDSSEAKSINEYGDVVMVTYYPLNSDFTVKDVSVVGSDFNELISSYPKKEIQFLEVGYPSGQHTKSSEQKQAEFFTEVFEAWDSNKESVKIINLNWLHERSPEELIYFEQYYGVSDKKFLDYLGTLGFITYEGQEKKAYQAIKEETTTRGW